MFETGSMMVGVLSIGTDDDTPYLTDAMSLVWQCGYSPPPLGLVAIGGYDVSSVK